MARRQVFAGNWKMYKTFNDAVDLVKGVVKDLGNIEGKEVVVFPPAIYIKDIVSLCKNTSIDVGIQNVYFEKEGAFTGEISPLMAKDIGVRYILVGHSERRHVFHESDEDVNKKIKAAFEFGVEPVVCVGELLEEREAGKSEDVVRKQVEIAFKDIDINAMQKVLIAYEPVWAIGTGKVATPDIADAMHRSIRDTLKKKYSDKIANEMSILYGGSVKPENIAELYAMDNIDGVLVGGASLKIKSFLDIINVRNKS